MGQSRCGSKQPRSQTSLAPVSVLGMIHVMKILFPRRESRVKQGPAHSGLPVANKSQPNPSAGRVSAHSLSPQMSCVTVSADLQEMER